MKSSDANTTTADALLGLLSLRPMSGYQIRQMIDASIGNFWTESFGQIYPALKQLEADGLVASQLDARPGVSGRASNIYELTALGREQLQDWLRVPARTRVPRNELLLKLFFGDQAGTGAAREHVRAAREEGMRNLERFRAILADLRARPADHPGRPYWIFTLRRGMLDAEAAIQWADETLAELEQMSEQERGNEHAG